MKTMQEKSNRMINDIPTIEDIKAEIEKLDLMDLKKVYSSEQESLGWRNKLIQGDNSQVLKTLLEKDELGEKVKLVYIDPPFSTNRDFKVNGGIVRQFSKNGKTAYNDRLKGLDYLKTLGARLFLLKQILSDSGSIYVHIDKEVGAYVKIVMDEIFGRKNYMNTITRIKCNPKNFQQLAYGNQTDTVLVYSKTKKRIWNNPTREIPKDEIPKRFDKIDEHGRRYTTTPLHAPGETENGDTGKPWGGLNPPVGRHWRYPPSELSRLDEEGLIEWSSTGNPRLIRYASEAEEKGIKWQDVWEFKDPQLPEYPTQKNMDMLKLIIETSSKKNDIVLDCYSGSGTTLLVAEQLGRCWVGIDNSKEAINVAKTRLKAKNSVFNVYTAKSVF